MQAPQMSGSANWGKGFQQPRRHTGHEVSHKPTATDWVTACSAAAEASFAQHALGQAPAGGLIGLRASHPAVETTEQGCSLVTPTPHLGSAALQAQCSRLWHRPPPGRRFCGLAGSLSALPGGEAPLGLPQLVALSCQPPRTACQAQHSFSHSAGPHLSEWCAWHPATCLYQQLWGLSQR